MQIPDVPEHALAQAALVLLLGALGLSVLLAVAALAFGSVARAAGRRRARRAARWTPALLALLDGELAPEAFAALVRPRHREDMLRFLVHHALRLRGDDRRRVAAAAGPLRPLARRRLASRSPEWRAFGLHALGLLSDPPPLDVLAASLRDPSPRVAMAAAQALAHTEAPDAIDRLLPALPRLAAAPASAVASLLTQFGLRAGAPITRVLADPATDDRTRVAVAEALQRLSFVPSAGPARALLGRPGLPRESQAALLRLLGEVGGPAEAASVRPFCRHADPVLRGHAVAALGRCGGPLDEAALRQALTDPDGWVALRAAVALGEADLPVPLPPPLPFALA